MKIIEFGKAGAFNAECFVCISVHKKAACDGSSVTYVCAVTLVTLGGDNILKQYFKTKKEADCERDRVLRELRDVA